MTRAAPGGCSRERDSPRGVWIMAQRNVQLIIGQILTDEEFRAAFVDWPVETLNTLRDRGLDLTDVEVDALARMDRRLWDCGAERVDRGFSAADSQTAGN